MAGATISFVLSFLLLCCASVLGTSEDSSLAQKCSQEFTKVTSCLDYATAKTSAPSISCCTAVMDIRSTDAACLCYIIQQTHTGSPSIKSLGLQFDRLLQLPDACKLVNSSLSNCPKLLNLTPSSPDYALFMNATKATSPPGETPTSSSGGTPTSSSNGTPASNAFMRRVSPVSTIATTLVPAVFFFISSIAA